MRTKLTKICFTSINFPFTPQTTGVVTADVCMKPCGVVEWLQKALLSIPKSAGGINPINLTDDNDLIETINTCKRTTKYDVASWSFNCRSKA